MPCMRRPLVIGASGCLSLAAGLGHPATRVCITTRGLKFRRDGLTLVTLF